jgi:hypothetical protein
VFVHLHHPAARMLHLHTAAANEQGCPRSWRRHRYRAAYCPGVAAPFRGRRGDEKSFEMPLRFYRLERTRYWFYDAMSGTALLVRRNHNRNRTGSAPTQFD